MCCIGWFPGFGDAAKGGSKLYKGARKAGKDFRRLSKGEIKQFKEKVGDVYENKINSRQDLFIDDKGTFCRFRRMVKAQGTKPALL